MRRFCGLLGLLLAGCMPLGYAFPTISYVRPASVGAARDEVRAFRVDVADDDNYFEIPEKDRYRLTPLPLHRDGSFDPQMKVAVDYGWICNCVAFINGSSTHHTVLVRMYRPGYQTLELESWRKQGRLQWTPASTPEEREQAIDDLVTTWYTAPARLQSKYTVEGFVPPHDAIIFRYLAPGSTSHEHRSALLFAAGEYDQLLSEVNDPKLRSRLEEKAKALRQLAAS
ncbi:MAG TPA: hypothetical protein VMG10_30140 [Gemmataceae bacterium]|nr:hypothetical protein [Gemmataceae bacterium]